MVDSFQRTVQMMYDHGVFVEIAVPTWAHCFGNKSVEVLDYFVLCSNWFVKTRAHPHTYGNECINTADCLHPMKNLLYEVMKVFKYYHRLLDM